jgi:hypothetical protein
VTFSVCEIKAPSSLCVMVPGNLRLLLAPILPQDAAWVDFAALHSLAVGVLQEGAHTAILLEALLRVRQ